MWLAAKYPDRVKSLSLHSGWPKSDAYIKTVVQGWQVMAKALNSVQEMVIRGIFPWCFTPELYAQKPDYIQALSDFVRGRPKQPVDAFIQQSDAVMARQDSRSDTNHLRAPRHGDLHSLRRPVEGQHQGFRAVYLRRLLARAAV
jgi:pimeloyl-ACP methyl ester carboxylesterase